MWHSGEREPNQPNINDVGWDREVDGMSNRKDGEQLRNLARNIVREVAAEQAAGQVHQAAEAEEGQEPAPPPMPAQRVTRTGGGYVADFVTPDGGLLRVTNVQGRFTVEARDPRRRTIIQTTCMVQSDPMDGRGRF